ncbi:MAG: 50S ribosomal protein L18e [Candidatus Nanoarchaeia archaeon]
MAKTGPTNPALQEAIAQLSAQKAKLWKLVARELKKPTRMRREINLSKIQRFAANGETVLVLGKVLAAGTLLKKVNVAAWSFSSAAKNKIMAAGGKVLTIGELLKTNPKGTGIKVIG